MEAIEVIPRIELTSTVVKRDGPQRRHRDRAWVGRRARVPASGPARINVEEIRDFALACMVQEDPLCQR